MNTFAIGSLPVHFSVAKLFNFRWQYTTELCDRELGKRRHSPTQTCRDGWAYNHIPLYDGFQN